MPANTRKQSFLTRLSAIFHPLETDHEKELRALRRVKRLLEAKLVLAEVRAGRLQPAIRRTTPCN